MTKRVIVISAALSRQHTKLLLHCHSIYYYYYITTIVYVESISKLSVRLKHKNKINNTKQQEMVLFKLQCFESFFLFKLHKTHRDLNSISN